MLAWLLQAVTCARTRSSTCLVGSHCLLALLQLVLMQAAVCVMLAWLLQDGENLRKALLIHSFRGTPRILNSRVLHRTKLATTKPAL
jgi:hypothetical protein